MQLIVGIRQQLAHQIQAAIERRLSSWHLHLNKSGSAVHFSLNEQCRAPRK